jgi:hypothetical protein
MILELFLSVLVAQESAPPPVEVHPERVSSTPALSPLAAAICGLGDREFDIIELQVKTAEDDDALRTLMIDALKPLGDSINESIRPDEATSTNCAELIFCRQGVEAFRALAKAKDIKTDDDRLALLDEMHRTLFEPISVKAPDRKKCPRIHQELWDNLEGDSENEALRLQGLRALAYLLFGAMHDTTLWPPTDEKSNERREAFITLLLDAASASTDMEMVTRAVEVALRPPLTKGDTCWLPMFQGPPDFANARGLVGFNPSHLELVTGLANDVEGRDDLFRPSEFKDRKKFMGRMALRIRMELHPEQFQTTRSMPVWMGSVDEMKAYFELAMHQRGWQSFWVEGKPTVEKLIDGTFPHPLDGKIASLEAQLKGAGPERGRLEDDLEKLKNQRSRERSVLIQHIALLFAREGDTATVTTDLVALTRRNPSQEDIFYVPWAQLRERDPGWAKTALEKHLESENERLPETASMAAIAALQNESNFSNDPDGRKLLLLRTGIEGSPRERFCVLVNSRALSSEDSRTLFQASIDDASRMDENSMERIHLMGGSIQLLYSRRNNKGDEWVLDELIQTFDKDGVSLWRGDTSFVESDGNMNPVILAWVANAIPSEQFDELKKKGRLPPRILSLRKS